MFITKRTVGLIVLISGLLIIAYLIWLVRNSMYPFLLAVFIAYLLNPAVSRVEKQGIRRIWAIVCIYLLVFGLIIVIFSFLVPLLLREVENFGKELPNITSKFQEILWAVQHRYQNSYLPHSMRLAVDKVIVSLEGGIHTLTNDIADAIIAVMGNLIGIAISPVLAFYLLHDWYKIKEEILMLIPGKWRSECLHIARDIDKVLSGVIRGQITVALIVGILVSIGLYLLNLQFALMIGIFAAIFDVIPYFGAFIGATPAVTLAILTSPWLALKVAFLFFLIHQLEGTIIHPNIIGDNVGLHPLSVIFFVFIGGELMGLWGMLLGVPFAAIIKVVLRHLIKILV